MFPSRASRPPSIPVRRARCRLAVEQLESRLTPATLVPTGLDDFRISNMGTDGSTNFAAFQSAVAYDSFNRQYLVVWSADDNSGGVVDNEFEIFGQRIDEATGARVGGRIRISDMAGSGSTTFFAFNPAVAYNSSSHEYLVVWNGVDDTAPLVAGESEIFGQRIDADTGLEIGTSDFRISDMGPNGDTNFGAFNPAVAYNSTDNQFLVVWDGDDDTGALVDGESEIFGQRLSASGGEIGVDFRISNLMGPDGDANFDALNPAVAYSSGNNQYLVVWDSDDNTAPLVDDEREIFGQRIDAVTGASVGTDDFRISDMGPDGDANFDAFKPAVAYNGSGSQYLVIWQGEDNTGAMVNDEVEVFGQRIDAGTGAEIGSDFRISDMGPDGNISFNVSDAAVAYHSASNEYLVVWSGDENAGALVDNENEIFGQRLSATGAEIGTNDFRISGMGPDGDANFDAGAPAVACGSASQQYLVVWQGDDNASPLVDNENEIFGQRLALVADAVPERGIRALLRRVRQGRRQVLFVLIQFTDTGEEKRRFRSPFQRPAFRGIVATVLAGDVVLTARRGTRRLSRTFDA